MGSVVQDGNASAGPKTRRVTIRNLPKDVTKEELDHLLGSFGTVQRSDLLNDPADTYANVVYETSEMADHVVSQLNEYDLRGSKLHVELSSFYSKSNGRQNRNRMPNVGPGGMNSRGSGIPLRTVEELYTISIDGTSNPSAKDQVIPGISEIVVPSELVGAIIGKKGQTIRNITTQCKARVDVHGKENSGLLEKVISIYGQPENCTNACKEILNVMQQEANANNRGLVLLKMLADDRYCGRIIGKEGKMIKKIREDTDTKITVSNMQEMMNLYPDRVITIRGSVDGMVKAESLISSKLNECIERDMQQASMPPGMMMSPMMSGLPFVHPTGFGNGMYQNMRRPYGNTAVSAGPNLYPSMYSAPGAAGSPMAPSGEMCQISVPNSVVGAIIGAGGSIIKQIMQDSNAHVTVEPKREDDAANQNSERVVTIRGSTDACWKASYFIFEKVKGEGAGSHDDIRLRTAIKIPKSMVGRVIGKSGKNVREIQRMTGANVKLPEDQTVQTEEVLVEVFGNFMAIQGAHNRIRALVSQGFQAVNAPAMHPPAPQMAPPVHGGRRGLQAVEPVQC